MRALLNEKGNEGIEMIYSIPTCMTDSLTFGHKIFWVAGTGGSELPKALKVIKLAILVSRKVEHGVLQSAGVSIRQDESIAVDPFGTAGRILHDLAPQNISDRGATHGGSGVSRIGRLDHVGADSPDRVDAFLFERHFVVVGSDR